MSQGFYRTSTHEKYHWTFMPEHCHLTIEGPWPEPVNDPCPHIPHQSLIANSLDEARRLVIQVLGPGEFDAPPQSSAR